MSKENFEGLNDDYEKYRNVNETGENILYVSTPNKDGSFLLQHASKTFKPSASIYKLIKQKDSSYKAYLAGDIQTEKGAYNMPSTYLSPIIEGLALSNKGVPYKIIKPAIINSDGTLFEKGKFDDGTNEKNSVKTTEILVNKLVDQLLESQENKTKKIESSNDSELEKVAELFKNNKIDQIIVAGEKKPDKEALKKDPKSKEKIFTLKPDLDAWTALYILNNFNKKSIEDTYNEGAVTSVIEKSGAGMEQVEGKKGLKVFLDVGGNWLKVEKDGETTTVHIDHHGSGKREPTSGTKMMVEIMEKADMLKEKPEWLDKFVTFVNDIDNLSYLEKTDNKGRKIFNESYFRNEWPNSLYALAEKQIPFETLVELCSSEIIKDPSVPFTTEELNGKIGNTKIGNSTIKELCAKQKEDVEKVLTNIKTSTKHCEEIGLNLDTKSLGKIVYHDYFKNKIGKTVMIPDHLAFKATKAKGFDTYMSWNKQRKIFFINSLNSNLSKIVEELNKADPSCAVDVRGVMVFGKIKNLTEKQFLDIIDPEIAKNAKLNSKEFSNKTTKNETKEKSAENTKGEIGRTEKIRNSLIEVQRIIDENDRLEKENKELGEELAKLIAYQKNLPEKLEELTEEELAKYKNKTSKNINTLNL